VGALSTITLASIPARIGPYRLQIYTEPSVIPVGKARIRIDVTDASGKPVEGAEIRALVQMPSMNMGEKEAPAQPVPGKPGSYAAEAGFAMAGRFDATLSIRGSLGDANGKVSLETGQDTGTPEGEVSAFSLRSVLPWVLVVAAALAVSLVLVRLRRTGRRLTVQSLRKRETIGGVLLILFAFFVSQWAIRNWRRPGAMTPIEAQSMEMSTTAPEGTALVTLAEVTRGPIENTVSYPGQAIAYNEQDVVVRSEGWLRAMPFYVGQSVQKDEVVAQLDISDVQEFAEVERMRAELRSRSEALDGSGAEVDAARQERVGAEADLASRQSMIVEAEAMIAAAEADKEFWQQQNARNKMLLDKRAISAEEFQRDSAMTANAVAKAQQAQARLDQARAEVRSAQAMVRKAEAMIAAVEKKRQQMTSDVTAAEAAVRSAEARAGFDAPHRASDPSTGSHGHVEIRAHLAGVVTARPIGLGQHVGPGQSILKIAQTDPIRLQANVAEADLSKIKPGSSVSIGGRTATDSAFTAKVTSAAPTVDPLTRTGTVEAVISNSDARFRPGQYLEMAISTGKVEDALRVPIAAVRVKAGTGTGTLAAGASHYVWVAEESAGDGRYIVTPVDVTPGVSDGRSIQIVGGLQEGQKVVTSGTDYLKRGDTVAGRIEASQ
jgi:RND family efflux transporter MFP subunit